MIGCINSLHSFAHANGRYHLMGCILSAASCNKWWIENVLGTGDYSVEQEGFDEFEQGKNYTANYCLIKQGLLDAPKIKRY